MYEKHNNYFNIIKAVWKEVSDSLTEPLNQKLWSVYGLKQFT